MRPDDVVRAIADSPFFQAMPHDERVVLADMGRVFVHGEGDVLFTPRQPPGSLVLVLEGLVEICRAETEDGEPEPVAYLGPGAVLGESKVITGSVFTSLARFPEGGSTLQWPRTAILRRLYSSRELSMVFLQSLARRLEGSFEHLGARRGAKLGGRLDHFNLATILQTVADSGAGGLVTVRDDKGSTFGTIHVHDRKVASVRCGTLRGREAFYEILISQPDRGSFSFSTAGPAGDRAEELELRPLLLESMRLHDEFARFRGLMPGDALLRVVSRQLQWRGEGDPELAARIWEELSAEPSGWSQLADRLTASRAQVALAVRQMLLDGSIESDRPLDLLEMHDPIATDPV